MSAPGINVSIVEAERGDRLMLNGQKVGTCLGRGKDDPTRVLFRIGDNCVWHWSLDSQLANRGSFPVPIGLLKRLPLGQGVMTIQRQEPMTRSEEYAIESAMAAAFVRAGI